MQYSDFFRQPYYTYKPTLNRGTSKLFVSGLRTYLPVMLNVSFETDNIVRWECAFRGKNTFSYTRLYYALTTSLYNTWLFETKQGLSFWAGRGLIAEPELVQIHFLIVHNKYYPQGRSLAFYRLYLSTEFIDPTGKFKLLYKKLYKDWLKEAMEAGLDVVITNDILSLYDDEPESNITDFNQEVQRLKDLPKLLYRGE